jgi:hypothetical protein
MNSLEQLVVLKESSCCVLGNSENGVQWGVLTTDYLLLKLCSGDRYKHIICFNIDRKKSDLFQIEKESRKFRKDVVCQSSKDFIIIENDPEFYKNGFFDLSLVYEMIKGKILMAHHSSCALFIYSLSEIILNVGVAQTISFMKRLSCLVTPPTVPKMNGNPNSAVIPTCCIIYVLHESLHSPHDLIQLQNAVSVVVRVVPNRGTLSPEVAAEIQTIRKSPNSGKVVECIELAVFRDGFLCPLTNKSSSGDNMNVTQDPGTDNLLEKLLNEGTKVQLKVEPTGLIAPRLITFDSTDPEFDEDSDPDADLDI